MIVHFILMYYILYIDIFDFDFFNKKQIQDLKLELLQLKENFEIKENLNIEKTDDLINEEKKIPKDNTVYYCLIAATIILGGLFLIYYYHNGPDNGFMDTDRSSNIFNLSCVEETEAKYREDKFTGEAHYATTPPHETTPEDSLKRYTGDLSPLYEKGLKALSF